MQQARPIHPRPTGACARARRGGALLVAVVAVLFLAGLASAIFTVSLARKAEVEVVVTEEACLYMAEAGLTEAVYEIAVSNERGEEVPAALGSEGAPVDLKPGTWWCSIVDDGGELYTVRATGRVRNSQRTIEAVVGIVGKSAFDHAIFAGNSSGDPDYELRLSGVGAAADSVKGDVYSGNDVRIDDDASITGSIYSSGTVTGAAGTEGVSRPLPDIAGMNYATNHDFDVAALFGSATWMASIQGGSAWQLPETSPAHIFRKNPDDRTTETSSTAKDDYFLEDPYEALDGFIVPYDGGTGHIVSLAETAFGAAADGNDKVYYIDGNLWVHNKPWGEMMLSASNGARVTFVVKGNVYFSDDVLVDDPDTGGIAFIAIVDESEPDSGNVYLGDPRYGTLTRVESYLYAENNFHDNNLSASGSATVAVSGTMTAGNAVDIQRDFVNADGSVVHSKLTVDFDPRLSAGDLVLPGIPQATRTGLDGWGVRMWREVAEQ